MWLEAVRKKRGSKWGHEMWGPCPLVIRREVEEQKTIWGVLKLVVCFNLVKLFACPLILWWYFCDIDFSEQERRRKGDYKKRSNEMEERKFASRCVCDCVCACVCVYDASVWEYAIMTHKCVSLYLRIARVCLKFAFFHIMCEHVCVWERVCLAKHCRSAWCA